MSQTPKRLVVTHDPDTDQLIVELHHDEVLRAAPVAFSDPLNLEERAALRWYLEEYLSFPVGAEEDRAKEIERLLPVWGARLFEPLFGHGSPGRDFYAPARNEGLDHYRFELRYGAGSIRNIPWELLHDPEQGFFLAREFASFSRRSNKSTTVQYTQPRTAGESLNLLIVTARPYGIDLDVPYRTVTGPLMEILQEPSLRDRIHVEMLRPPTFREFERAVQRKHDDGQPFFDVVHFDGHGGFGQGSLPSEEGAEPKAWEVLDMFKGPAGMLVFETEDGTEERVEIDALKQVVGEHRVPLVVLNACRSGMEALETPGMHAVLEIIRQSPEVQAKLAETAGDGDVDVQTLLAGQGEQIHSVAGSLLDGGASAVVSMGFIVRAKAAAIFMRGFYKALLEGGTAAAAVRAGRVALMTDPHRPTQFGELPLQDWMVPVYSERFDLRLFAEMANEARGVGLLHQLQGQVEAKRERQAAEEPLPPRPRFGFVGRDKEILMIERALLDKNLAGVALVGLGGHGKTTLAVGTARWMLATNAPQVAGGVFFHAFFDRTEKDEPMHPNLAALLRTIGRSLFGQDEFLQLSSADQRQVVAEYLRTTPSLLVLDNAETVAGLGEAPALLNETERDEMTAFLRDVCVPDGSARLLVTSRRDEPWLDLPLSHLEVGGLDREAADELARQVLAQSMDAAAFDVKRHDPAWSEGYQQLLKTLGGHPMALQIVLPHLEKQTPDAVLEAFAEGASGLDSPLAGATDRERTLRGSLDFSVSTLSERSRRLLPFLAFFREWVDPDYLGLACQGDEVPKRLRDADDATWMETLLELQSTGLVTRLGDHPRSPFALHALLPWYLATTSDGEDAEALQDQFRRFAAGFAGAIFQGFQGGGQAAQAVQLFRWNAATLRHALDLARRRGQLDEVSLLYQCLYELMTHGGQARQAERMIEALSEELRPDGELDSESTAGWVWLDLQLKRANHAADDRKFDEAEAIYKEIVEAAGESAGGATAALTQLGTVALERRDLDEAERWYSKALELLKLNEDPASTAVIYHQLGRVAEERRDFDAAERWYQKSLELKLQLDDPSGSASSYHQLGTVAHEQRDFDGAERWCQKSLELSLQLDNSSSAASSYHQLGRVAQERRDFDGAERWYQKSLELSLQLDNPSYAASSYHQLGLVAQKRRDFDGAERWYQKSLELKLRMDNLHGAALTQAQLGIVAFLRGHGDEGADLIIAALRRFRELNDPHNFSGHLGNLNIGLRNGLIDRSGVEALWQKHFEAPIPDDIAEILFAEGDAESPGRPRLPDEMRQALIGLLDQGLSFEQVVQVIEHANGETMPPEMVDWLRSELDRNAEEGPDDAT